MINIWICYNAHILFSEHFISFQFAFIKYELEELYSLKFHITFKSFWILNFSYLFGSPNPCVASHKLPPTLIYGSFTVPLIYLFYFPTVILQRPCSVCVDIRHAVCDQQWRETVRAVPTVCGSLLPSLQHPPEKRQPLPQPVCFGEEDPLLFWFNALHVYLYTVPICPRKHVRRMYWEHCK